MYIQKKPWVVNYEESEIPPYQLPELLKCQDGTMVSTAAEWTAKRRPELLRMFREIMYGAPPPMPDKVRSRILSEKRDARNGLAVRREILLEFLMDNGMRHSVIVLVYTPAGAGGKVPVCVNLTFGGNHVITEEDDVMITGLQAKRDQNFLPPGAQVRRYPIDDILKRGYALAVASYNDFYPDSPEGWSAGIYELFHSKEELQSKPQGSSAIAAWAWGFSRILDLVSLLPEIDGDRALCIGHSRLGKSSLWAGVQDERFKVVCVNNSGCGGAALDRRLYGETLYSMFEYTWFGRSWFSEKMEPYALHPEKLPFDQHELIALVAPRTVVVHSATEDRWADPRSEYLGAYHAGPAFALFGQNPLASEVPPPPDHPIGTDVGYFLRTGGHDLLLSDWNHYLDTADRVFRKNTVPAVVKKGKKAEDSLKQGKE